MLLNGTLLKIGLDPGNRLCWFKKDWIRKCRKVTVGNCLKEVLVLSVNILTGANALLSSMIYFHI